MRSEMQGALVLGFAALLLLPACSVNVEKEKNGEDKQVDIKTPMGGIHVGKGVNPEDVGIAIYPGARLKQRDTGGDDKSANVDISGFGYGLKVVALEYESNDAPGKDGGVLPGSAEEVWQACWFATPRIWM